MKSKRQTIWLVSMLSLMVILSAYYLFTEDSSQNASKPVEGEQVVNMQNPTDLKLFPDSVLSGQDVSISEVTSENGTASNAIKEDKEQSQKETNDNAENNANTENKSNPSDENKQSSEKEQNGKIVDPTVKDEEVLKQLESQGTTKLDQLTTYQQERSQTNAKRVDELLKKINDGKTLDESAVAQKELRVLEENEEKINGIEERLQQQYANAVVTEDNNQYKVVVASEKLEAKDAVNIVDLVIKELGVSQDKVSVQYVSK